MNKSVLKTGKKYVIKTDGVNEYCINSSNIVPSTQLVLSISGFVTRDGEGSSYECPLHSSTTSAIGQSDFFFCFSDVSNEILICIGAIITGWNVGTTGIFAEIGVRYHLAAVWDGTIVKCYVDGVLKKTYNLSSASPVFRDDSVTRIGASSNGLNYQSNSTQSDIRLYNRVLTYNEVKQLSKDIPISNNGLQAHWLGNQSSGTTLVDISNNGYDMTMNNGAGFITL